MGASRCRLGGQSASRKKSQRDNTGHEGGRGGGGMGSAAIQDHYPLWLAAHIHSPRISLLFLPAIIYQASALLEKWCHSAVATDIHSANAALAARVSHCKVSLCSSKNVRMFVCAVSRWWLLLYKLVLTGRDRGCVECDEGAMGALSDSWRSKLLRVSSSLTHSDPTDQKMTVLFLTV